MGVNKLRSADTLSDINHSFLVTKHLKIASDLTATL